MVAHYYAQVNWCKVSTMSHYCNENFPSITNYIVICITGPLIFCTFAEPWVANTNFKCKKLRFVKESDPPSLQRASIIVFIRTTLTFCAIFRHQVFILPWGKIHVTDGIVQQWISFRYHWGRCKRKDTLIWKPKMKVEPLLDVKKMSLKLAALSIVCEESSTFRSYWSVCFCLVVYLHFNF